MVEHAKMQPGPFRHVQIIDWPERLQQAEKVEGAVERADLAVGGDHSDGMFADADRPDHEPFRPDFGELWTPSQAGDDRRILGCADDDGAVAIDIPRDRYGAAEQTRATVDELGADGCAVALVPETTMDFIRDR